MYFYTENESRWQMKFHSVSLYNLQRMRFILEKGSVDYLVLEEISMLF